MNKNRLIESIKEDEGFSSKPYIDPIAKKSIPKDDLEIIEKHWDSLNITIGYGRNLQDNYLSEYEATELLVGDIDYFQNKIVKYLQHELNIFNWKHIDFITYPHVVDVLTEMAYQLGFNGLLKFKKTLQFVKEQDFENASKEMLNSLWAKQTPNRAKKLSHIMKGGYKND